MRNSLRLFFDRVQTTRYCPAPAAERATVPRVVARRPVLTARCVIRPAADTVTALMTRAFFLVTATRVEVTLTVGGVGVGVGVGVGAGSSVRNDAGSDADSPRPLVATRRAW